MENQNGFVWGQSSASMVLKARLKLRALPKSTVTSTNTARLKTRPAIRFFRQGNRTFQGAAAGKD